MDAFSGLWPAGRVMLLLAGLLGPGAAWMWALRLPITLATAFSGSAVALYASVLALQFASVRISLASLTTVLAVIALAAVLARRRNQPGAVTDVPIGAPVETRLSKWVWAPLCVLFWTAVVWRAWHEPLSGPDVGFRWSFLAEQMLRIGNLDFYPPRSAADFTSYFWAESVPPGVSALYAWAYACAGGANAAWTVAAVVLQLGSMHELLWRTAEKVSGARAAHFACLAAAASPLLTWSFLLGQETGLTALSLIGIAFALLGVQRTGEPKWAALAGLFAVLGTSAREYGVVFPLLGAAGLLVVRANRRTWLAFGGLAAAGAIWPLRTFILTGNPFYSLAVGGFPTNARFLAWIEHDAETLGNALHQLNGWRDVARFLILFAPGALVGGGVLVFGAIRGNPKSRWALASGLAIAMLWFLSVRYTNGGLFYSLRVAGPAFGLAALAAGIGLAAQPSPGLGRITPALLALIVMATFTGTLTLPQNPWRTPIATWRVFAPRITEEKPDEVVEIVRRSADRPPLALSDAPGFQQTFATTGIRVIPLWSTQADWLFDLTLTPEEAARGWRNSGVTHVIVTKFQTNLDFFNARSRWSRPPFKLQLMGETSLNAVFAIRAID